MIVPSIDIMRGRAVQLRRGREFVLDGGDPVERLEQFSLAGEVAVVDLDAALSQGSNADLIEGLVRRAPCRVGGGIRDLDAARRWLDAGATQVMIGTAATPEFCGALPRDRVIAAVDAERGAVVVDGWRTSTGIPVLERVRELAGVVGGFLFTQVDKEGAMGGFDRAAVDAVVRAAAGVRVTAAGGITTAAEIAELDSLGADAQVGMALYTGRLSLGDAVAAPLAKPIWGELWPTVVCDEAGRALGLVWSTRESLARAVTERRGIYWSRSRIESVVQLPARGPRSCWRIRRCLRRSCGKKRRSLRGPSRRRMSCARPPTCCTWRSWRWRVVAELWPTSAPSSAAGIARSAVVRWWGRRELPASAPAQRRRAGEPAQRCRPGGGHCGGGADRGVGTPAG